MLCLLSADVFCTEQPIKSFQVLKKGPSTALVAFHLDCLSVIDVKSKRQSVYSFALGSPRRARYYFRGSVFQFLGKGLVALNKSDFSVRKTFENRLLRFDRRLVPREVPAPVNEARGSVSASLALSPNLLGFLLCGRHFSFDLRRRKTAPSAFRIGLHREKLDFDDRRRRLSCLNWRKRFCVLNADSGKTRRAGRLEAGRICWNSFEFSANHRFALVRGFGKRYSVFAPRADFALLTTFECGFASSRAFFGAARLFVCHSSVKRAIAWPIAKFALLERKGEAGRRRFRKREGAFRHLRKRLRALEDLWTRKVGSHKVDVRERVPRLERFFEGSPGALGKEERKVNALCQKLALLEARAPKEVGLGRFLDFMDAKVECFRAFFER